MTEVLRLIQPFVYGGLALLAFVEWRRRPGPAAAWLFVAFAVLGFVIVAGRLLPEGSEVPAVEWARKLMIAVLVLFPYYLFRFTSCFVRPPYWIKVAAAAATAAIALGALVLPAFPEEAEPRPGWFEAYVAALLIQWVFLSGLVAVRLWRAGRDQAHAARSRMRTMSLGAAGLALALVVAGELSDRGVWELVVQVLVLAAGPMMLVGFAPPYVLRAWWRRGEDEALRRAALSLMKSTTTEEVARTLLPQALSLLAARGGVLETAEGEVVAGEGNIENLIRDTPSVEEASSDLVPSSEVIVPMGPHRLRMLTSPFTPFFGRDHVERVETMAGLAEFALARNSMVEALEQREAMLAAVFETSPDIIATITSGLELTYVNPAALRTLGYEFEQLFGEDSLHWVHPDDLGGAAELLQAAFGVGETGRGRLRVKNAAGEWLWLDIRIRRMEATADAAVVVARDITDQVRLEDDLKEAKKIADEANLAKSEFLSRMSHELRTPLNAILGFGQLLEMEPLSRDQLDSTEQIVKGGRRLLDLINEVLDISRIESGTLQLSLEPVPVGEVVRDAIDLIRPLAEERGVRLRSELTARVADRHVVADQQRLGQILLNLLSNAVKYNVEHGAVSVSAFEDDVKRIRIGITDTGPGISDDKIAKLFTPFERLGAEGTSVEGTGLGLALSKSLVEAMGGRLQVDTMRGQGSTFWVELHASNGPTSEESTERAEPHLGEATPRSKILYIEDNLSNLRLIERLMSRRADLELLSAMTGTLGLDMAQQHRPDLILLDLHLPDLMGQDVLIRLRKDPRTRDIPVVILSADATPGQIERLRVQGADDYVTKPIDVLKFVAVVDGLLASEATE